MKKVAVQKRKLVNKFQKFIAFVVFFYTKAKQMIIVTL